MIVIILKVLLYLDLYEIEYTLISFVPIAKYAIATDANTIMKILVETLVSKYPNNLINIITCIILHNI